MSDDRIEGAVKQGVGRVQDAFGGLTGDGPTQLRGKLNDAAGSAQNAYGKVKDQAGDVIDQARDQFADVYDQVEDFVREQPLTALAVGAGLGLVLGLMLRGGRKVVYVRK
jgi:uncharacterized protein YjbJ (UPF0337 family)